MVAISFPVFIRVIARKKRIIKLKALKYKIWFRGISKTVGKFIRKFRKIRVVLAYRVKFR